MILLENSQQIYDYQNSNVTFIDTNLTNYQSLIPDNQNGNVFFIDSQSNGIEQITEVLEQYSNLDSISIFSHGDVGSIQLGNTYLSNSNLNNYQDDLATWGNALSAEGDLLLYGCNVGGNQAGLNFANRVADITGADLAASDDLTGNAQLGGDWVLEVAVGKIETPTFELTEYDSLLDLNINLTFDEGTADYTRVSFETAAKMWSNVLNDDATINIHIKIDNHNNLPENVLAGAVPFFETGTSYSTFRNHLSQDRLTSDDYTAVDSLETGSTWAIDTYGGGIANIPTISLTRANAKALNLINPHDSQLDGVITMRGNLPWQKIYNNPLASNKFDMTSVAMHEMGHILGFVGTLDSYNPSDTTTQLFSDIRSQFIETATTLDLFRYGRDYSTDKRLIKFGAGNFSIDGGVTTVGELSYGTIINGDNGYQASHWRNVDNLGLMDPVAELGQRSDIGNLDLTALDVIGWDRVSGTKSVNTLYNEAKAVALPKIGVNRNIEVDQMLADWRWARRGSASRLRQAGDIAQFLAQEGFFSIGSFRSTFEFSSTASTKFLITVKEDFSGREFESNLDLGAAREIVSYEINSALLENTVEDNLGINYEELLALITEELSDAELNQLSLDDLAKLIEQHLAESVV